MGQRERKNRDKINVDRASKVLRGRYGMSEDMRQNLMKSNYEIATSKKEDTRHRLIAGRNCIAMDRMNFDQESRESEVPDVEVSVTHHLGDRLANMKEAWEKKQQALAAQKAQLDSLVGDDDVDD